MPGSAFYPGEGIPFYYPTSPKLTYILSAFGSQIGQSSLFSVLNLVFSFQSFVNHIQVPHPKHVVRAIETIGSPDMPGIPGRITYERRQTSVFSDVVGTSSKGSQFTPRVSFTIGLSNGDGHGKSYILKLTLIPDPSFKCRKPIPTECKNRGG